MRILMILILCMGCLVPATANADEMALLALQVRELTQTVRDLKLTVENQSREIAILKNQTPPPFTTSGLVSSPAAPASRSLQGRWNPDIGVVADSVLKLDSPKADAEGADRLSVRELELVFGSAVDPYSRFDATISFSDFEAASLEEAYLTCFELPWDLKARIGRFKPRVGKAIPVHRDSLETVDEPLVIQRYFGLEGYNKTGLDVSKILDLPSPVTHEFTAGILEGGNSEGGTAFGSTKRRPTIYAHLKNYADINEATGLEAGGSYLVGSRDADSNFEVQILGLDGTWIHHLNSVQNVKLQGEVFHMNREETEDSSLWGAYGLVDFRINSQWAVGFRFDDVELVDNPVSNPNKADIGYTGHLTFYQSEFARWRAQFSHIDLANGNDDNQVLLQGTFAIGEHKHKLT